MADQQLDPELLAQQSQQMLSLKSEYESLLSSIVSDLNGINSSWSELLANNFSGKIQSAQQSFSGVLNMLHNGSAAASLASTRFSEMDQVLAQSISGAGSSLFGTFDSTSGANQLVAQALEYYLDQFSDARDILKSISELKDSSNMPAYLSAWLEAIEKKAKGKIFGDWKDAVDVAYKLVEGDYEGALEDLGETGFEAVAKAYIEANGLDVSDSDMKQYVKYAINLTEDGVEAITEFILNPSAETAGKIAWNVTAQPILDTAGSKIYSVVNMIPGVSDYYAKKGAEDIGGMASIALGDFYGLVTGDESMNEYAATYYAEHGGLWESIYNAGEEVVSFIQDSGGFINAAKNFVSTAASDSEGMGALNLDNLKTMLGNVDGKGILWHAFFED